MGGRILERILQHLDYQYEIRHKAGGLDIRELKGFVEAYESRKLRGILDWVTLGRFQSIEYRIYKEILAEKLASGR